MKFEPLLPCSVDDCGVLVDPADGKCAHHLGRRYGSTHGYPPSRERHQVERLQWKLAELDRNTERAKRDGLPVPHHRDNLERGVEVRSASENENHEPKENRVTNHIDRAAAVAILKASGHKEAAATLEAIPAVASHVEPEPASPAQPQQPVRPARAQPDSGSAGRRVPRRAAASRRRHVDVDPPR